MIKLGSNEYKVIYLDTNILRATLEMSEDIHINTISILKDKSIFAISILTLVEMSHRENLIKAFIRFINSIPILILKPSNQILEIEKKKINSSVSLKDLILLISNPLIPTTKDKIISFLLSFAAFLTRPASWSAWRCTRPGRCL